MSSISRGSPGSRSTSSYVMPAILPERSTTYGRWMQRRPVRFGGRDDTALVVVLDCTDLDRSAAFWCGALGYVGPPAGTPGPYRQLVPAGGDGLELRRAAGAGRPRGGHCRQSLLRAAVREIGR